MAYRSNSIWQDIKRDFITNPNIITRLITVNVAVFILLGVCWLALFIYYGFDSYQAAHAINYVLEWFAINSKPGLFIRKPWTIITYMFTHLDLFHILSNMLILFFIGSILRDYLGNRKILPIYIMGGLAGGILFMLVYNLVPSLRGVGVPMIGASAGVMAILIATATLLPEHTIRLFLFGNVKLKYLALAVLAIDLLFFPRNNLGGHIAHLGGAAFGFVYIKELNHGRDFAKGFNKIWDALVSIIFKIGNLFTSKPRPRVAYRKPTSGKRRGPTPKKKQTTQVEQDRIDAILDKISQSGYDSLTKEEKELLFRASNED